MTVIRCKTCGVAYFDYEKHGCAPQWECRYADEPDAIWAAVYAHDSSSAAENFVEEDDSENEVDVAHMNRIVEVLVKDVDGVVHKFAVHGEVVATYDAEFVEEKNE